MHSSHGQRRPPASERLLLVAGLLAAALCAAPVRAQPSPGLYLWLAAQGEGARQPVLAPGPEAPPIPPGSVIGEVRVVAKDIFDPDNPGENNKLFRFANRLHRSTRTGVIERQLLFKPGDVFSPELIAESARILRSNEYLYDVDIRPMLRRDGKVEVEVTTRDVWTLQGGVSFGRAGGKNNTSFSVNDSNFLGTGKEVSLARIGTVDRTSNLVRYTDPNLLGSRVRLLASYADNSDGGRQRLEVERPFYSLDTRWAAGVRSFRDDRLESLYSLGKAETYFRHLTDFVEAYGGYSPGLTDGVTHRWEAGFTFSREDFSRSSKLPASFGRGGLGKGLTLFPLPPDRELAYPWVRFESIQSRYVIERDLDRIQRSEDLNLGRQYSVLLGLSSPTFGGDGTRWIAQSAITDGWRPTPGQLVLFQLGASTRWAEGDAENLVAGGRVRYYLRDFGSQVFYASLGADLAHRLDGEDQLLLGGDSGLRGYPLRYQAGDRRFLLTLEQRFYSDRELFHVAHLGAAVFFDAGQAWFVDTLTARDRALQQQVQKVLKDIGFGLRIASSRSSRGAVLHLDVAFPLDGNQSISRVQWLVSTGDTF